MTAAPSSAATAPAADRTLRGIALMLLCVVLFSCMDALVKAASADYSTVQIVFFRNVAAFVPVLVFVARSGGVAVLRTRNIGGHLLRTAMGLASMVCAFKAFALLPLGDAVALTLSGPLFLTALSVPLLREQVGARRWTAVAVGFVGILVMTRPGTGVFQPAAVIAVGAAVFYALAMIMVRRLGRIEPLTTIVFYMTFISAVASGALLPFEWVTPDATGWLLLLSIGIIGGTAQFAMTEAFRLAPASTIAPFDYLALVFAASFGYAFWGEVPDLWLILGAAIVIGSGLYILHRETRRRTVPTRSPVGHP